MSLDSIPNFWIKTIFGVQDYIEINKSIFNVDLRAKLNDKN